MNRLNDVFIVKNLQILNEGKGNGLMKVRGIFQKAEEENNNKRIYPKAILEREVKKLQESIKGQRLLGELDHPEYDSVKLSNVSHKVTSLEMNGNDVIGEAVILNTPAGIISQKLIEGGVALGISSRGLGSVTPIEEGRSRVNEDFNLTTFDFVADPSTKGAFPQLTESTKVTNIVKNTLNEFRNEAVIIKKIKDLLTSRKDTSDLLEMREQRVPKKVQSIKECIKKSVKSREEKLLDILKENLEK